MGCAQVNAFEYGKEEQFAARYRFLTSEGDRSALLAFGAKLMLYQPPVTKAPTSALQVRCCSRPCCAALQRSLSLKHLSVGGMWGRMARAALLCSPGCRQRSSRHRRSSRQQWKWTGQLCHPRRLACRERAWRQWRASSLRQVRAGPELAWPCWQWQ